METNLIWLFHYYDILHSLFRVIRCYIVELVLKVLFFPLREQNSSVYLITPLLNILFPTHPARETETAQFQKGPRTYPGMNTKV